MLESIQKNKNHIPILTAQPSAETRWDRFIDKTICANIIIGDLCTTLEKLLSKGESDYEMLSAEQKLEDNISEFTHTEVDKLTLCQFEGAAAPAKRLSKFLQDNCNAWTYVLFESRLTIQDIWDAD